MALQRMFMAQISRALTEYVMLKTAALCSRIRVAVLKAGTGGNGGEILSHARCLRDHRLNRLAMA